MRTAGGSLASSWMTAFDHPSSINSKSNKNISRTNSGATLGANRSDSSGKIRLQTPIFTAPPVNGIASPPKSVPALVSEATLSEMSWRKKSKTSASNTNNNNWTIGYNTNYGSKTAAGPHTSWATISKSVKMSPSLGPGEYASGLISGTSEGTVRNNNRAATAGSPAASNTEEKPAAEASKKPPVPQSSEINKPNVSPVRRFQIHSLEAAKKDAETPLLSTIMMKSKPMRPSKKSQEQQVTSSVSKVNANVISRTSHRVHVQQPQDIPNLTARLSKKGIGKSTRIERKQEGDSDQMGEKSAEQRDQESGGREHEGREVSEVEVATSSPSNVTGTPLGKQPVYPKGANQLLVASATQVGNTFNNFQLMFAYFVKIF